MSISLHRQLLRRLALPLLLLLLLEGAVSYALALHFSQRAYDAGLYDSVRALAQQVKFVSGRATLSLPREALEIIQWDVLDQTYFAVDSVRYGSMLGHAGLPRPSSQPGPDLAPLFYDTYYEGVAVRAVAVRLPAGADEITVMVGETLVKRASLTREIVLATLLPGILLTLAALLLLQRGIRAGLAPLGVIARQIESRGPGDFRPIGDAGPAEVRPLTKALNDLLRALAAAHASQRRFIANAAHQLRTPLAALRLQSERALGESDPAAHAQALQHVVIGTKRVAHISRQLLMLARAEPEVHAKERFADVDLAALAREVTAEWVLQALERDVDLGYAGPETPLSITGDTALLRELMANLIDNALCYGREGGRVTVGVIVDEAPGGCVKLFVEDDGPGIPPQSRRAVFDRFVRLPGSQGDGCGLGLAIVREISSLHGGEAIAEGGESGGVRITVSFPRKDAGIARRSYSSPPAFHTEHS